jgi:hypothetical protein
MERGRSGPPMVVFVQWNIGQEELLTGEASTELQCINNDEGDAIQEESTTQSLLRS